MNYLCDDKHGNLLFIDNGGNFFVLNDYGEANLIFLGNNVDTTSQDYPDHVELWRSKNNLTEKDKI